MALIRSLVSQEKYVNYCSKSEKHDKIYCTWEGTYVSVNEDQAIYKSDVFGIFRKVATGQAKGEVFKLDEQQQQQKIQHEFSKLLVAIGFSVYLKF